MVSVPVWVHIIRDMIGNFCPPHARQTNTRNTHIESDFYRITLVPCGVLPSRHFAGLPTVAFPYTEARFRNRIGLWPGFKTTPSQ